MNTIKADARPTESRRRAREERTPLGKVFIATMAVLLALGTSPFGSSYALGEELTGDETAAGITAASEPVTATETAAASEATAETTPQAASEEQPVTATDAAETSEQDASSPAEDETPAAPVETTSQAASSAEATEIEAAQDIAFDGTIDPQLSLADVMGTARYYGIVTNKWYLGEAETNAAVKQLYLNAFQSGNDLTAGSDNQPWVIGGVGGGYTTTTDWSVWPSVTTLTENDSSLPFNIKGRAATLYAPENVKSYIANAKDLENTQMLTFHPIDESAANKYVDGMFSDIQAKSANMAGKSSIAGPLPAMNSDSTHQPSNYQIDFTESGPGTYYVNVDSIIDGLQSSGLRISKTADQTIVFNVTKSGTVNLQKFEVTQGGTTIGSDLTNATGEPIARTVVWNIPNASEVNANGSIIGMVLAPNARFNISSTCAGWLVANSVLSMSGEWHNVWQSYSQDYPIPDSGDDAPNPVDITFKGTKTLAGHALADGQFTFSVRNSSGDVVATGHNDANGDITFSNIEYTEDDAGATYTYTVSEDVPDAAVNADGIAYASATPKQKAAGGFTLRGVTYDSSVKTVTVSVSLANNKLSTSASDNFQSLEFSNSYAASGTATLHGTKTVTGKTVDDLTGMFTFRLSPTGQTAGDSVEAVTDAAGAFSVQLPTYTAPGTYTYELSEVNVPDGWKALTPAQTVTVTVTDNNDGTLQVSADAPASGYSFENSYTPKTPDTPATPDKPNKTDTPVTPPDNTVKPKDDTFHDTGDNDSPDNDSPDNSTPSNSTSNRSSSYTSAKTASKTSAQKSSVAKTGDSLAPLAATGALAVAAIAVLGIALHLRRRNAK